jgi:broad specificity phosphatase PhoE
MTKPTADQQKIYLIRHGETEWALSRKHTGHTDIALSPQGEHGALQLTAPLHAVKFNHVFSSPLQRAQKTAELAGFTTGVSIESDLIELNYGEYEGRTTSDIRKTRSNWNLFRDGCPGGESPDQIAMRADRLIAKLRALEGNIALFSHGHFGRVLAARWIGMPGQTGQYLFLSTASISILGFDHNSTAEPVIELWNKVADS